MFFRPFWAPLGVPWGSPGASWGSPGGPFGLSWGAFGDPRGHFGSLGDASGPPFEILWIFRVPRVVFETSGEHL